MSKYTKHVFFCINDTDDGKRCCADSGAKQKQKYAKQKLKSLKLHDLGKIRINRAGCLGLCDKGPALVVYPEGVWYSYVDNADIDEIIDQHLLKGQIVQRLLI